MTGREKLILAMTRCLRLNDDETMWVWFTREELDAMSDDELMATAFQYVVGE